MQLIKLGLLSLLILIPSFKEHKEVKDNHGPMFYAAEYSSDISDEPYYSTQNSYTFQPMNLSNVLDSYRGDSVKVAVIDSGLNYEHEDFKLNGTRIINSKSRSIEYSSSWYYYEFSNNESHLNDSHGHGTNVASVIASQINGVGCAGIAPNVELYVYKVTNSNNGYEWTAINNALQYCIDNDMDVINMSFQAYEHEVSYGGSTMPASSGCSSVLTTKINACYNAGITLVGAAGNYNTNEPSYPASNNHVISVGSLAKSSTTTKAGYSNTYGIDIVAPGSVYVADVGSTSAYKETQGTSFSAPIVTAAIALYKQKHPTATPSEIESALYASCDAISGNPSWAGNGRLNLEKFINGSDTDYVTSITLNNIYDDGLTLEKGSTFDIDYTVNGVGDYSHEVTFELMNDDGTISLDSNGRITALKDGEEMVTISSVQDPSIYEVFIVTVETTKTLSSISVSGYKTELKKGTSFNFGGTVTATYSDSSTENVTSLATFAGYDMSTNGRQTVTVSYGGKTTSYNLLVCREVSNIQQSYTGSVSYVTGSKVISGDITGVTATTSGYTTIENAPDSSNKAIRLGSGSNTGTITINSPNMEIHRVVVNARVYNSDSGVTLSINGVSKSITTTYTDYDVTFDEDTNSFSISNNGKSKRAWISTITLYTAGGSEDISLTSNCVGLENFVIDYMHMDYVEELGYCKDSTHHYYVTAKSAFNSLNSEQRAIFTSNTAYSLEWDRLSAWAAANGDSLNSNNTLATSESNGMIVNQNNLLLMTILITLCSTTLIGTIIIYRKKRR